MSAYKNTHKASGPGQWLMRVLLKIMWSVGGKSDEVDGLPRLTSDDVSRAVTVLEPGDFVLLGNNGLCSHVAVYIGTGTIVHSMATEKTMRGMSGSFWDALWRPWRWFRGEMDHTGVIEETLGGFLDRYERDTWMAVRRMGLDANQIRAGIARVQGHVGKAYDYDFNADDDEYYCTELVVEYLDAALPEEERPKFETKQVRVPGLIDTHVIEPVAVLEADHMRVTAANSAAKERYADHLEHAQVV